MSKEPILRLNCNESQFFIFSQPGVKIVDTILFLLLLLKRLKIVFLKYFYSSAAIMFKCLIFQYGYSVPVCVVLLHRKFQLWLGLRLSERDFVRPWI